MSNGGIVVPNNNELDRKLKTRRAIRLRKDLDALRSTGKIIGSLLVVDARPDRPSGIEDPPQIPDLQFINDGNLVAARFRGLPAFDLGETVASAPGVPLAKVSAWGIGDLQTWDRFRTLARDLAALLTVVGLHEYLIALHQHVERLSLDGKIGMKCDRFICPRPGFGTPLPLALVASVDAWPEGTFTRELEKQPKEAHAELARLFPHQSDALSYSLLDDVIRGSLEVLDWLELGAIPNLQAIHSADFTYVSWRGTEYTFALGVQSTTVKALWQEHERTGLGLHQETIRKEVDPERDNFRLDKVFRGHPAFGAMIQSGGDGRFRLVPP